MWRVTYTRRGIPGIGVPIRGHLDLDCELDARAFIEWGKTANVLIDAHYGRAIDDGGYSPTTPREGAT